MEIGSIPFALLDILKSFQFYFDPKSISITFYFLVEHVARRSGLLSINCSTNIYRYIYEYLQTLILGRV